VTQAQLGAVLDARWAGAVVGGARAYPVDAYRAAFAACAAFVFAAALLSLLVRETYGRNIWAPSGRANERSEAAERAGHERSEAAERAGHERSEAAERAGHERSEAAERAGHERSEAAERAGHERSEAAERAGHERSEAAERAGHE